VEETEDVVDDCIFVDLVVELGEVGERKGGAVRNTLHILHINRAIVGDVEETVDVGGELLNLVQRGSSKS